MLWHIRLIKGDTYLPYHCGMVVEASSATEAEELVNKIIDNRKDGEFEGYEPTADVIEFVDGVATL